jgi:alkylhydroperoxidase family enzyme
MTSLPPSALSSGCPLTGRSRRFRRAYDPMNFEVIGLLVRYPDLARAFLAFNGSLIKRGELPSRLRELVIMRVAHRYRSVYEWGQHVRMASENGVSGDDIVQLIKGNNGFTGDDLVVLEVTDELLANPLCAVRTFGH